MVDSMEETPTLTPAAVSKFMRNLTNYLRHEPKLTKINEKLGDDRGGK